MRLTLAIWILTLFASSSAIASETRSVDVTFTNKMVGDKKTWVMEAPKVQITQGTIVKAKLINTMNEPHGFEVPGLLEAKIVKANETTTVEFGVKKGNINYRCHMHPAHVGGSFDVM